VRVGGQHWLASPNIFFRNIRRDLGKKGNASPPAEETNRDKKFKPFHLGPRKPTVRRIMRLSIEKNKKKILKISLLPLHWIYS